MRNDYFNSRPSARGDNTTNSCVSLVVEFQFTPLREGRRCKRNKTSSTMRFQFTPLREGRPSRSYSGACALRFQFTPLREGRRHSDVRQRNEQISIHAPPRGATCFVEGSLYGWVISIHAPPRGATNKNKKNAEGLPFQFTPLREGRLKANARKFSDNLFQFTPLREGRRCLLLQQRNDFISIHAPPRGATWILPSTPTPRYFNSRPSARGDAPPEQVEASPAISIHAPPRGATILITQAIRAILQFQFTPLREGRRAHRGGYASAVYFNSRPSARGDHRDAHAGRNPGISIHAPPRGATSSSRHVLS